VDRTPHVPRRHEAPAHRSHTTTPDRTITTGTSMGIAIRTIMAAARALWQLP
jgi:hypothetical protein